MILLDYKIDQQFSPNSHIVVAEADTLEQLKQLPDQSFKLIVSSPPYNIGKEYEKQIELDKYLQWLSSEAQN